MKTDLVFLIVLGIVIAYIFVLYKVESMADVGNTDQIKEAVKQIYMADVEAIRNLSAVATQIQASGLTVPAHMNIKGRMNIGPDANAKDFPEWLGLSVENAADAHIRLKTKADENKNVYLINRDGNFKVHAQGAGDMFGVNHDGHTYTRHTGDHALHINGDGNNPYISLGKTDTWDKKKIYIQNVDAHTETPIFRVGVHGVGTLMDMNKSHGVRFPRKDGRTTHFDWEDNRNYIRGNTSIDGSLITDGIGMRTWILNSYVNNGDKIIIDPEGSVYNADRWILGIIGFNQDSNWDKMGGRIELYTYVNKDNNWCIRGELEGPDDRAGVRILAMPINYFDKAWGRGKEERVNW